MKGGTSRSTEGEGIAECLPEEVSEHQEEYWKWALRSEPNWLEIWEHHKNRQKTFHEGKPWDQVELAGLT